MKPVKVIVDAIPVIVAIAVMLLCISVSYYLNLSGTMLIAFITLTVLVVISTFALLAWLLWRAE